ncbi:MAG: DUF4135 domain-containing protein [Candidatus Protochlamydia sp.]|nr:DUF4135 domain-containing protein [Candidatus Protochlamydia sp.]
MNSIEEKFNSKISELITIRHNLDNLRSEWNEQRINITFDEKTNLLLNIEGIVEKTINSLRVTPTEFLQISIESEYFKIIAFIEKITSSNTIFKQEKEHFLNIAKSTQSIFYQIYLENNFKLPSNKTSFYVPDNLFEVIWDISQIPGMQSLPQDLFQGVITSSMERNLKLKLLTSKDLEHYQQASNLLDKIESAYWKHLTISQSYFLRSDSETSKSGFSWIKKKPLINENFVESYNKNLILLNFLEKELRNKFNIEILIDYIDTYIPVIDNTYFYNFIFNKEKSLNKYVNEKTYQISAFNMIEKNKEKIFNEMSNLKIFNSSLYEINKIEFISKSSETHNQGKKPLFVTLRCKLEIEKNEIKLVLKPRDACLDKYVIKIFSEINKIDGNNILPEYNIINIDEFSIWENIEGPTLSQLNCRSNCSAQSFIEGLDISYEKKDYLCEKLKKMACVLSMLGVSDLHSENIIFKGARLDDVTVEEMTIDLRVKEHPQKINYSKDIKKVIVYDTCDIIPIDLEV